MIKPTLIFSLLVVPIALASIRVQADTKAPVNAAPINATPINAKLQESKHHDEGLRITPVVKAVRLAGPAVVNVYTKEMIARRDMSGDFFRDVFEPRYERRLETTSLGSGTIIDAEGHVLTNNHVVKRGTKIRVALVDHREFDASIVGTDPDLDLAVLQLHSKEKLPFVPMGDSASLLIGETVIAIGNPFGLSNTVTTGVVSATHRSLKAGHQTFYDFIQTDTSINPGNSGGPLLNIYGQLIGINTAVYGNAQGIGFAIPANRARRITRDLIAYGRVQVPYVGVDLTELSETQIKKQKLTGIYSKTAVQVLAISKNGPSQKAGLRVGDIILAVENFPTTSLADYSAKLREYSKGDQIKLRVLRKNETLDLVILAEDPPLSLADRILNTQLGISIDSNQAKNGARIIAVQEGSMAARAGLRKGDKIIVINDQEIHNLKQLRNAVLLARRHGEIRFKIMRGHRSKRLRFTL